MTVRSDIVRLARQYAETPFAWGSADCLCFCADVVRPILGRDPIDNIRGGYDSEVSAKRYMIEHGWRDLGDVAASVFPEIPPSMARAADWAFVRNPDGTETLGVVVSDVGIAKTLTGVGRFRLTEALRAFMVTAR